MIAPSTGGSCYLSVTPSPTYSAICYIWECLAAESSFGQTVGHAYPSLTYGRFQRGGLTFQWQLGRCLQIADLHRECRLIPSLDLNLPVRGPPALVIRQRNMYTAEASAMAESRHRARASGSAAMSPFSSFAMRGEHMNVWQVSASTIQTGNGRFVRACRSRKHTWRTSAIPIPSTKTGQTGSGPASAIVASGSFGFHSPWTAPSFGVPVIPGQIGFSE